MRDLPEGLARHRRLLAPIANVAVIGLAYTAAFLLRFDFTLAPFPRRILLFTLIPAVVIHYGAFLVFKVTRGWWRYVGINDFLNIARASILAALGLATYVFFFHRGSFFPRGVFLLNFVMVIGLSIAVRLIARLWRRPARDGEDGARRRLLVMGAGDTAEALLRQIHTGEKLKYRPVAVLDDDRRKHGLYLDGVPVVGAVDAAPEVVRRRGVEEIVIAIPSASGAEMRRMIEICRACAVPFRVIPATWELLHHKGSLAPREVDIHDLLRRPPVELDTVGIGRFLSGRRVLVTGAAGSIGSEICRQVLDFRPAALVCLDHDENALFYLDRLLATLDGSGRVQFKLADITDGEAMRNLFAGTRPEVVFHAAAHKHVGLLESNVVEAVRNNVLGTQSVARLAGEHGASAFVLVSTDKAVNPSSVMGATKRVAELMIQVAPHATRYTAVRFGNVLGSQGSVVPLLKEQIAAGGPVTLTHPDMRRFFMTIPEAVQLVIQAAAMGTENEVFMLDMGEPVKIVDLARDLIQLSGLRPEHDIEIVFTGVRPGEKIEEELTLASEEAAPTSHSKIHVARRTPCDAEALQARLAKLAAAAAAHDADEVRRVLQAIVPEFRPAASAPNVIPFQAARRPSS